MTDRELMQMALDCLLAWEEESSGYGWSISDQECVEALRARLAQPEPEPVAWIKKDRSSIEVSIMSAEYMMEEGFDPLYTAPPQREWQGLTDEEAEHIYAEYWNDVASFIEAIEAKLKEKNT